LLCFIIYLTDEKIAVMIARCLSSLSNFFVLFFLGGYIDDDDDDDDVYVCVCVQKRPFFPQFPRSTLDIKKRAP